MLTGKRLSFKFSHRAFISQFDSFPFCINFGRGQHVSKPCKRVYVDKKELPLILDGLWQKEVMQSWVVSH